MLWGRRASSLYAGTTTDSNGRDDTTLSAPTPATDQPRPRRVFTIRYAVRLRKNRPLAPLLLSCDGKAITCPLVRKLTRPSYFDTF